MKIKYFGIIQKIIKIIIQGGGNMKNKILAIKENKELKLTNILTKDIQEDDYKYILKSIELMETYIKSKGAQPIGALIQYTSVEISESGEPKVTVKLMRQVSTFIDNVEPLYTMEPLLRVKNCLFVRFMGEESKLKSAYDKLQLYAYEKDIELKGNCYTIFVEQNEDTLVADIFMEQEVDE